MSTSSISSAARTTASGLYVLDVAGADDLDARVADRLDVLPAFLSR
jgi:hypothetical protein